MIKDELESVSQDLGLSFEQAQNTLDLKSRLQLLSYITDKNYISKQIRANGKFKISLFKIANQELRIINQKYEKSFEKVLKSANLKENKEALQRLDAIKKQNALMLTALANRIYLAHMNWVNKINIGYKKDIEVGNLSQTEAVYNNISKVLNDKLASEEVAVVYSNGSKHSFKSYMEMEARTTLNQEVGKQQMEAAVNNGDVFWLCNSFEDCRPEHLNYQGKVYYDERYLAMGFDEETLQKIESAIVERNMVSRQSVEDSGPLLGNCPNCRHEFVSVPIEDVITMSNKELLKDNNMNVDRASEENYYKSQEQRLYERKIRDYKFKVEQDKILLNNAPAGINDEVAQKSLNHNKMMLDRYYGRIRTLIKDNPDMERNYARESVQILSEDLGYRARKR